MARYVPSASIQIVKPCGESWEAMAGSSRVRHCAACDRDVINTASLTPEQIERHIAAALHGAPMPCMRLVQFEDGALLTARSQRRVSLFQRAVAGLSALAVLATGAVAQEGSKNAMLTGRIIDAMGEGISGASVRLQQPNQADLVVKTAADGTFKLEATPGNYDLSAESAGFQRLRAQRVTLHNGAQDIAQPLKLEVAALMGEVVVVQQSDPLKTQSRKTERKLEPTASPQYANPARH